MRRWILAFLLPLCLQAGGWDPVSPDTWTIKADSTLGASGAVVLLDWYRYGASDTERRMRILVLNEAGKASVQIDPFSPYLSQLEGRVLYPDGHELAFDKAKDFSTQTVKRGSGEVSQQVLVPPGVTDHCIMDIHWTDKATYLWGDGFNTRIQRPFPVKELVLRLPKRTNMASVWLVPKDLRPVISEDADYHIYTFKDLPPREIPPYSYEAFRFSPQLRCFPIPNSLIGAAQKPGLPFWVAFTTKFVRKWYAEDIKPGKAYRAFAQGLLNGLPVDPVEKAIAIKDRLNDRILNSAELTFQEKSDRGTKYQKDSVDADDLDQAVERKWTNGYGMFDLLYELYQDAGLHPKLLLAASKVERAFMLDVPDWRQLDGTFLGVDTADGKGAWWTNAARFPPSGIISSFYQGTDGLLIDTRDWTVKTTKVPIQPSSLNTVQISCEVTPGEDSDAFVMKSLFSGTEEWAERSPFVSLSEKEAQARVKSQVEEVSALTATRETVFNAGAPGKSFGWEVAGTSEPEGGRKRKISPFPGTRCPWWIPDAWPEHRVDPVVMSVPSEAHWTSRVMVPPGWKFSPVVPIERNNSYGKVSWKAELQNGEKDSSVLVSLDIVAPRLFGPASSELELRDFLAWIQEAYQRRLPMERAQ